MKIFLLDCTGFSPNTRIEHEYRLFEVLMVLCNCIMFNNRSRTNNDDTAKFLDLLENTKNNLQLKDGVQATREHKIFPNCMFHLYRSTKAAGGNPFTKYFNDYSFTFLEDAMASGYVGKQNDLTQCSFLTTGCINEKYVRHISQIFRDVLERMEEKSINGVTYNGNIVVKLILALFSSINKNPKISVDQIFKAIISELYMSAYNFCVITYSEFLQQRLGDENPKPLGELIEIFQQGSEETMSKYNEFNLDAELHREYLLKLQNHIDMKERLILEINKKKSQNTLRSQLAKINNKDHKYLTAEQAASQIHAFGSCLPRLDHGREDVMMELNQQLVTALASNLGNYELQRKYDEKTALLQQLQSDLNSARSTVRDAEGNLAEEKRIFESKKQVQKKIDAEITQVEKEIEILRPRLNISSFLNPKEHYNPILLEKDKIIQKLKGDLESEKSSKPVAPTSDLKSEDQLKKVQSELATVAKKQEDTKKMLDGQKVEIEELKRQIDAKEGKNKKK